MKKKLPLSTKINALNKQKNQLGFIYVGDCGVDIVDGQPRPGGCALNVVYYLHELGQKADVLTWIGNDLKAKTPLKVLHKIKANPIGIHFLPGQTPAQHIVIQAGGEKKFTKYEAGVLDKPNIMAQDLKFINQHQILITLYYSQIAHLFEQVSKINFNGIKIIDFMNMVDFNFDLDFVKKNIEWLDIGIFGINRKQTKLINGLKKLAQDYQKLFIITLGEGGSKIFWCENEYFQPTETTSVIDTTGCGDAYLAGFLADFIKKQNVSSAMQLGSRMASKVSQFVGAMPEEVR